MMKLLWSPAKWKNFLIFTQSVIIAGADPGFPVGGGAYPQGRQHTILPNFPKLTCVKLRKCWAVGGGMCTP